MQSDNRFMNEVEVSEITGMSLSWLRKCRMRGEGIPYSKVGRSVRYKADDVSRFMDGHRVSVEA